MNHYQRTRLLLLAAAVVSFALFWFAGRWFEIPVHPDHETSLLGEPSAAAALLVTTVVFLAAAAAGTLIAGGVRADAGLFAAALGLSALSLRGGPMRYTLQAGGPGVFLRLLLETAALGAVLGLAWYGLRVWQRRGRLKADALLDGVQETNLPAQTRWLALAAHALITAALISILIPNDAKKQVLWALGISAFAASALVYWIAPVQPSVWYWAGPLVAGAAGYALHLGDDNAWRTGATSGWAGALARPLPLDYASVGAAAAILGYWMARRWRRDSAEASQPATSS